MGCRNKFGMTCGRGFLFYCLCYIFSQRPSIRIMVSYASAGAPSRVVNLFLKLTSRYFAFLLPDIVLINNLSAKSMVASLFSLGACWYCLNTMATWAGVYFGIAGLIINLRMALPPEK